MQIQSVKCSDTRIWYYKLVKEIILRFWVNGTHIFVKVLQFDDETDKIHSIVKFFEKLTREVYFRTP